MPRIDKWNGSKSLDPAQRERIIHSLAQGLSIENIAEKLHHDNRTVMKVRDEDFQEITRRKEILAALSERGALLAAERINAKLESKEDIPLTHLVPVFGVYIDKTLALRGEPLVIEHSHQHIHAHINECSYQNLLDNLPRRNHLPSTSPIPVDPPPSNQS